MKQSLTRALTRYRRTFTEFSTGQKAVVLVGTLALVIGGAMLVRWAMAPSYSPLYSDLAPEDASAVVEHLESEGIPYQLGGGGGTVMVPRDRVYDTRIALSGEGLPGSSESGYSLLDEQGLSTSEFQEKTSYKRAMEGELSTTIEAMDPVETAVVHLAIPEKEVFADEQDPTTASVLVDTRAGKTLDGEQVQAIVHLVASSVDGLDPDRVTVTDAGGRVLSAPDGSVTAASNARNQQTTAVQQELQSRLQGMLDRVVGTGNSTVEVTAKLDFDKAVTETTRFTEAENVPPIRESSTEELYEGPAGDGAAGGVVGPDGQMDDFAVGAGGDSAYEKRSSTQDNSVNSRVERRETAPGAISNVHVGVVLDTSTTGAINPQDVSDMVAGTVGIDVDRGDTVSVTSLPFDRTAEDAAAAALAEAKKEEEAAARWQTIKYAGIGLAVLLALLLAWLTARRRARAREQATSYVVEQLRAEQELKQRELEPSPATLALEQVEVDESAQLRDELVALVERQPDDVAALLRGWLVDRS